MVAGAAGDDLHIAHLGEQLGGTRAEGVDQDVVGAQAAFHGALHDLGLLMDFLEHEVAVLALVGSFGAFVVLHLLALHGAALLVPDLQAVTADLGDIAFFQVDEAVGDLAQGQLVGSEEVLAQAQADHQRAAAAGGKQAVRLAGADHRQAIGTMQFRHRCLEGVGQIGNGFQLVVQQMDDDFGVGVRGEDITLGLELLTQSFVVFDDAVVDDRQLLAGEVRVGIALAGGAVGGPAGVGDAQATDQRLLGQGLLQLGDLAGTTAAIQLTVIGEDGHTGAVIATVFEALQALDQNGGDIALGDGANDATHGFFSYLTLCARRSA
ncbi:hypothetical protein D9M71_133530 [compost metagenome]